MANSKKLNKLKNKGKFSMNDFFNNINTNKYFIGLMMIFMNLGSRFIELNLTKGQEMIFKNVAREVLIFTIAFMGSRDIFIALVITAVFIILSNFVFNENCKYNILPEKYKKVVNAMDFNEDGKVSQDEIDRAQQILEKAKQQDELNNKISMLSNISDE